jgi:putative aldouronate transport system permease protein
VPHTVRKARSPAVPRRGPSVDKLRNYAQYHLMMVPAVVLLIIFAYIPMGGIVMAFQDYNPLKGLFGSTWVGLDNYRRLLTYNNLGRVFFNTIFISVMKIISNLIVPVTFALLLNEFRKKWFVRAIQTAVYLPYFLSWVILSGVVSDFLSPSGGTLNAILSSFGVKPIYFLGDKNIFPFILIVSDTWRSFGYDTIVYLAALTAIDPTMYEAALVDGATRWQQTRYVTIPAILQIIVLMMVLAIRGILDAGFDQVFNLYNPLVYETSDIIDTVVYRMGMLDMNFSLSTAVGLLKSIVSLFLIVISYQLADRYAGYRIF